ncbi:hypothetical protein BN873_350054 [Candidatus Competibacter denitrificans Run_A_D11]|uniref:Uncharacterized protein n=1 Tax=Candidatus Competibacter denitrificans Run_A_D11 TaxID=1400863 RepID=W6MDG0_9GAMM|nr:hypothetical protein BN873_350054 [Candidatus Competibacter denitrificans Run_A_D11]
MTATGQQQRQHQSGQQGPGTKLGHFSDPLKAALKIRRQYSLHLVGQGGLTSHSTSRLMPIQGLPQERLP